MSEEKGVYELRHQPKHSAHWYRTTYDDRKKAMESYSSIRACNPSEWVAVYDLKNECYLANSSDER